MCLTFPANLRVSACDKKDESERVPTEVGERPYPLAFCRICYLGYYFEKMMTTPSFLARKRNDSFAGTTRTKAGTIQVGSRLAGQSRTDMASGSGDSVIIAHSKCVAFDH
jgi:hypothetical protein